MLCKLGLRKHRWMHVTDCTVTPPQGGHKEIGLYQCTCCKEISKGRPRFSQEARKDA